MTERPPEVKAVFGTSNPTKARFAASANNVQVGWVTPLIPNPCLGASQLVCSVCTDLGTLGFGVNTRTTLTLRALNSNPCVFHPSAAVHPDVQ